jgi:putative membrane protein
MARMAQNGSRLPLAEMERGGTGGKPALGADAALNTLMAAERTLLSWTRTALSLITFGFTIYNFLRFLVQAGMARNIDPERGPRHFAAVMILLGVGFLAAACVQYLSVTRPLRAARRAPWRLALYLAVGLALLGVAALVNVVFQVEI